MKITVNADEVEHMILGFHLFKTIIARPDMMTRAVAPIASSWHNNFIRGGALYQSWAPLAEQTRRVRELRGHGVGPILGASGQLYKGAIKGFLGWPTGKTSYAERIASTKPDVEGIESGETAVVASVTPRRFKATISGAKAIHQTGGLTNRGLEWWEGSIYTPARPFWFFAPEALNESSNLIMAYALNVGLSNLPNWLGVVTSTLRGAPSSSPGNTGGVTVRRGPR